MSADHAVSNSNASEAEPTVDMADLLGKLNSLKNPSPEIDRMIYLAVMPGSFREKYEQVCQTTGFKFSVDIIRNQDMRIAIVPNYTRSTDTAIILAKYLVPEVQINVRDMGTYFLVWDGKKSKFEAGDISTANFHPSIAIVEFALVMKGRKDAEERT